VSIVTTNPATDSVIRDNAIKPVIPPVSSTSDSDTNSGLSTDRDKAQSSAVIASQSPTYEQPQNAAINEAETTEQQAADQENNTEDGEQNRDGSSNESSDSNEQFTEQEQAKIEELKARDLEVVTHEQAHATVGGQYAGSPSYSYETGPDGIKYAVSGEVSIDISKIEGDPQATLIKAQQVKRAALAPVEPSGQDRIVAASADQLASEARTEIVAELNETDEDSDEKTNNYKIDNSVESQSFNERAELAKDENFQQTLANRSVHINAFYQQSSQVNESSSFQHQI